MPARHSPIIFICGLVVATLASASPPADVGYQGWLVDAEGSPLVGPVTLEIGIWDAREEGALLYAELHADLVLSDGVFRISLGTGSDPVGTFDAALFAQGDRWLEVSVETGGTAETLAPRQPFGSVAYSLHSQEAATLGGRDAADLDQSDHLLDAANPHGVTAAQAGASSLGHGHDWGEIAGSPDIAADEGYRIDGAPVLSVDLANLGTYVGANAGWTVPTGNKNTFVGHYSGFRTSSGSSNVFIGYEAGKENTSGSANTFVGVGAGADNLSGGNNAFFGGGAGGRNTTAHSNTFLGAGAGSQNETGATNTFVGRGAGAYSATGHSNTFVGGHAGGSFGKEGYRNTFIGAYAGYDATTGIDNVFVGYMSGRKATEGSNNTLLGNNAGFKSTTGHTNTFIGNSAGYELTTGDSNTFVGRNAGRTNVTGTGNVFVGHEAGYSEAGSNRLYISNSSTDAPLIYGEFDTRRLVANGSLEVDGSIEASNGVVLGDGTTLTSTGIERTWRSVTVGAGQSSGEVQTDCPAGTFVLAGGWDHNRWTIGGRSAEVSAYFNMPAESTGWKVGVRNGAPQAIHFTVWAICAAFGG